MKLFSTLRVPQHQAVGQDGMLLDLVVPGRQMLSHKAEEAVDRRSQSTSQRPADRAGLSAMEMRWRRTAGVLELFLDRCAGS